MSKLKNWPVYLLAYSLWIISFLLWLWFILIGRNALLGLLQTYYLDGTFQVDKMVQLWDRVYLFSTGLAWLALMVITENSFRQGIKRGDLARRVGRIMGPEFLLIFAADAILAFLFGFESIPWSRWLVLLVELAAGAGLVWLAVNGPKPVKRSALKIE